MNINYAWLAGFMEGEGTFSIYCQRKAKTTQLRACVSVTNTDPALINKAFEIFEEMGVSMHIHEYSNKKGSTKPVYDMQTAQQSKVKTICEELLPYLVGEKKEKAKMLLRFVNQRLEKRGPDNDTRNNEYDDEDWALFNNFRSPTTTREAPTGDDIV